MTAQLPYDFFAATLSNSIRLINDSKLLNQHGRYRSAAALAISAIEELGKALIFRWAVINRCSKRKNPSHLEKQAATFALLSANELVKKRGKRMRASIRSNSRSFFGIGPFSDQFVWARSGFYEDLRMFATYSDLDSKMPARMLDKFSAGLTEDLVSFHEKAYRTIRNTRAMAQAAIIFENDLGRM